MDFMSPNERNTVNSIDSFISTTKKRRKLWVFYPWSNKRLILISLGGMVILTCAAYFGWKLSIWQPAVVNPFPTSVVAAMKFPLYYPTNIPQGFKIDTKSLTQPMAQVVVFDMVGPNGAKLYVSEESRPATFNLGGFYDKFEGLQEIPVSDGSIAVGKLNSGQIEVASRANDKTWIFSNTTANIPLGQLVSMLKSITIAD